MHKTISTLPEQLHTGDFRGWAGTEPTGWRGSGRKPEFSFWTSTRTGPGTSGWTRWCLEERGRGHLPAAHRFLVVNSPRILVVACDEDIESAAAEIGVTLRDMSSDMPPPPGADPALAAALAVLGRRPQGFPWDRAAEAWDAIHVPEAFSRASMLSSWDCESTAWLRPHLHLRHVGEDPRRRK